jgi:hypothetical protein
MKKSLIVGVAVGALALFGIAWAAAPVLTAKALVRAAKAGDERKVEAMVDFPALRESLKAELNAELAARMSRDPRLADSGLGGLGMMLAPMILSGAVDAVVTPQVVTRMVTTAEAPDPNRRSGPEPMGEKAKGKDIHQSWGYRGFNQFAVTLTERSRPDEHLALILERRGLFDWKLAAVDLQTEAGA